MNNRSSFPIDSTSEEADQKIVRHALHCTKENYAIVKIHSIDYVLILLIYYVAQQMDIDAFRTNLFFKMVSSFNTWYDIISLINEMEIDICKALPFFFAYTGCDTVSSFHSKGKCTIWDHWMKSEIKDEITRTFIKLGSLPQSIEIDEINTLETFVKSVYFGNSQEIKDSSLNKLGKIQFISSASNNMRKIAPSSSSLNMHALKASYQAGFVLVECAKNVDLPDPCLWGYSKNAYNDFVPKWLSEPPQFDLEMFLQTCPCKSARCRNCKCAQLKLPCLPLCLCHKSCSRM